MLNPIAIVSSVRILNPSQVYYGHLIVREFLAAGMPASVALAAVVNAYAESRLDPNKLSGYQNEDSVGLFQINAVNDVANRTDATVNTRWIIDEVRRRGGAVIALAHQGGTVAQIADAFARDVERCDWSIAHCSDRESVARQLYGPLADVDTSSWSYAQPLLTSVAWFATVPWWAWTVLGVGATGATLLVLRRR